MLWLKHPKFAKLCDEVLEALRKNEYRFRRIPNVLFLCGGYNSKPRDRLAEYIRRKREDTILFYAEEVWNAISKIGNLSALEMESKLADLSDIVVIIVESPGTFAELGAFSLSDPLRKKLLPILEIGFRGHPSFIETGPVRWIDADSAFRPSIWVPQNRILEAAAELENRLDKLLPNPRRIGDLATSPKHLLFFLCDLVAIFGPCPQEHLSFYTEIILKKKEDSIAMLLGLGRAMGLLKSMRTRDGVELFFRPLEDGKLHVFHYTKKHFGIPTLRAKILSVMQTIEPAREALEQAGGISCS